MKNAQLFLLFLCFTISLGAFAQSTPVGNWKAEVRTEDGAFVVIKASLSKDGNYIVDMGGDGIIDINGKYQAKDGKLIIQDKSGPGACSGKGIYKLEMSANTMEMILISDECKGRAGPEGVIKFTRI
ncbi:MAG: hypothetical protein DHS20C18_33470 [Saprospiraceae bacterium]|nr:MAG: hypothetical protein DHS20C18_33470 [Saprospiraceae bacterium]